MMSWIRALRPHCLYLVLLSAFASAWVTGVAAGVAGAAPQVVASTSWVGAIAEAAGASDVTVLAPLDLRHPPEYDFKPSDIQRVLSADYIIYAGYEGFIGKIRQMAAIPDAKMLQVTTVSIPQTLLEETRKLAKVFGTEEQQQAWEREYNQVVADVLARAAKAGVPGKRAVVHAFLAEYAEWLGFDVIGTFGGGVELTPVRMAQLVTMKPDLIIDNWHNEQGAGIAQAAGVRRAVLINFPGHAGTRSLMDVLLYNASQLGL
jgi:zinc transport system substrate-binding protein